MASVIAPDLVSEYQLNNDIDVFRAIYQKTEEPIVDTLYNTQEVSYTPGDSSTTPLIGFQVL